MSQAITVKNEYGGYVSNGLKLTKYIIHKPTAKQQAFLLTGSRFAEVMYGGAAGGGKSDALLMGALQYVDVPGYNATLFRRTFADLDQPEALIPRSKEWLLGTDAHWRHPRWTFPSGATITFAYLETNRHVYKYQSAAFQYVGFDELTQFAEFQYTYLFSRLRRLEGFTVPLRMRSATNPGGFGHDWVKQRFIKPDPMPEDRLFISAKLADNPHVDREEYIKTLGKLDPITRQQLLEGDWEAQVEGTKFKRPWFKYVEERPRKLVKTVRYWDLAGAPKDPTTPPDYSVGCLVGLDEAGLVYVMDVRRVRLTSLRLYTLMDHTAKLDGLTTKIVIEQEPGSAAQREFDHIRRKILQGRQVQPDKKGVSKAERANPAASHAEQGDVYLVNDGSWDIESWLDEVCGFPYGQFDDQVDGFTGGFHFLTVGSLLESLGSTDPDEEW